MRDEKKEKMMNRVRAALLPCPFCGGKATESDCEWGHDLRLFGIKCDACLARSSSYNYPPGDAHGKNVAHEMAIAAWNRRSPLLSGEGLCERLEQRQGNYDESVLVAPADHDALEAAALIRSLTAAKDKAERERDEWQQRESETQEALQAIGEEFGAHGGEPRTNAMRRLLTEDRARIAALEKALVEAKEALRPFAEACDDFVLETDSDHARPEFSVSCGDLRRARSELEGR